MTRPSRRRGEPLVALGLIMLSWVGLRAAFWQEPYVPGVAGLVALRPMGEKAGQGPVAAHGSGLRKFQPANLPGTEPMPLAPTPALRPWRPEPLALRPQDSALTPAPAGGPASRQGVAAASQLLWMAAMAGLPSPQALLGKAGGSAKGADGGNTPADLAGVRPGGERRWSGDGWLMWREGGAVARNGVTPPTYGASQGGVVLRYRLAPNSAWQPTAYLRLTGAMDNSGQADSAFGFSARPIGALPVIAAVEGRVSRFSNGSIHLRPAAMVITELTPQPLPFAMRAEIYGAAGYVGGPGATGFVDGQVRLDHHLATVGPTEIRAGGGLWGGAQQGASRLDVGPAATVRVAGDHFGARLGLDWRLRVAGDAAPTSGPAVTLSAGF